MLEQMATPTSYFFDNPESMHYPDVMSDSYDITSKCSLLVMSFIFCKLTSKVY